MKYKYVIIAAIIIADILFAIWFDPNMPQTLPNFFMLVLACLPWTATLYYIIHILMEFILDNWDKKI